MGFLNFKMKSFKSQKIKFQVPSAKLQTNFNSQIFNDQNIGIWVIVIFLIFVFMVDFK